MIQNSDGTVITASQSFIPKLMIIGSIVLIIFIWIIYYYSIKNISQFLFLKLKIESKLFQKIMFFGLFLAPIIIKLIHHYSSMPWHDNFIYDISRSLFLVFVSLW